MYLIDLIADKVSQTADTVSTVVGEGRNFYHIFTAELEQRFRDKEDRSIHHKLTWRVEEVGVLDVYIEGTIVFEYDDRTDWLKKASIETEFEYITACLNGEALRLVQQIPSTGLYSFEFGAVTGRLIELPAFIRSNCPVEQFANHN